ncbi:MAG: peptide-methionine (S)-S-oxide reductase [Gammaproteobacteria bacterium]|nr:MAG: peptide-methionine (S)-S-oxide reductase [Gammaproteobacteria bacterium]
MVIGLMMVTWPFQKGHASDTEMAVFAGGCFWCMESDFEKLPGVLNVVSGYTGGHVVNPSYRQVSAGGTGHAESVRIEYDPKKISYTELLDYFWRHIDPLTPNGQFCDHGSQYRTAIFYLNEKQKRLAESSRQAIDKSGRFPRPVVTEIVPAGVFYPAEEYHQDYYRKNPLRYHFYRFNCGRDDRLDALWNAS